MTGNATQGAGGMMNLAVGAGDTGSGGAVMLTAGESLARGFAGGQVAVMAGLGSSTDAEAGGSGGDL
eukprot:5356253-Pyramimonas_sp.AAC.1